MTFLGNASMLNLILSAPLKTTTNVRNRGFHFTWQFARLVVEDFQVPEEILCSWYCCKLWLLVELAFWISLMLSFVLALATNVASHMKLVQEKLKVKYCKVSVFSFVFCLVRHKNTPRHSHGIIKKFVNAPNASSWRQSMFMSRSGTFPVICVTSSVPCWGLCQHTESKFMVRSKTMSVRNAVTRASHTLLSQDTKGKFMKKPRTLTVTSVITKASQLQLSWDTRQKFMTGPRIIPVTNVIIEQRTRNPHEAQETSSRKGQRQALWPMRLQELRACNSYATPERSSWKD